MGPLERIIPGNRATARGFHLWGPWVGGQSTNLTSTVTSPPAQVAAPKPRRGKQKGGDGTRFDTTTTDLNEKSLYWVFVWNQIRCIAIVSNKRRTTFTSSSETALPDLYTESRTDAPSIGSTLLTVRSGHADIKKTKLVVLNVVF